MDTERRRALTIAGIGMLAVVVYATVMVLQILVWNPLAAVPGRSRAEIVQRMAAVGEWSWATDLFVVSVAALGISIAVALTGSLLAAKRARALWAGFGFSVILTLGAPAYWMASFSMGMSLADTFMISGADVAPWATPLHLTSGVAFLAAFVLALRLNAERADASASRLGGAPRLR